MIYPPKKRYFKISFLLGNPYPQGFLLLHRFYIYTVYITTQDALWKYKFMNYSEVLCPLILSSILPTYTMYLIIRLFVVYAHTETGDYSLGEGISRILGFNSLNMLLACIWLFGGQAEWSLKRHWQITILLKMRLNTCFSNFEEEKRLIQQTYVTH